MQAASSPPGSPTISAADFQWPDWVPLRRRQQFRKVEVEEGVGLLLASTQNGAPSRSSGFSDISQNDEASSTNGRDRPIHRRPAKHVVIPPDANRIAKRDLTGLQLFMISLNGTLGTGLYWSGGLILELGGPVNAVLSFVILGLVAWLVMQCLTELLCMWPVPGALSVYVSTFVDEELGIAVGICYWFTYSVSFSALITSMAQEVAFWAPERWLQGVILYLLVPVTLTAINWSPIKYYGYFETIVGTLKIAFYVTTVVIMIAISTGAGHSPQRSGKPWSSGELRLRFDHQVSDNWAAALINCLSQAAFSYIGVEIIAASALEAGWRKTKSANGELKQNRQEAKVSDTIRNAAMYFPVAVTVFYVVGVLVVSMIVPSDHCDLPRMDYAKTFNCTTDSGATVLLTSQNPTSVFTIAARMSGIPYLADLLNAFQVFTALFCASTNLYVASRTLFALTSNIDDSPQNRRAIRWFAKLGKTNHRKVPLRAITFSAVAFSWVPLLQLIDSPGFSKSYGKFTQILVGMGSDGVLIVWFCNIWAFLRFYYCIRQFHDYDELKKYDEAQRDDPTRYPLRSHQQPHFAWLALGTTFFLLIIANGAPLWTGFQTVPFVTAYVTVAAFIALYILLKIARNGQWELADLSKPGLVAKKIQKLNDTRYMALETGVPSTKQSWQWRSLFSPAWFRRLVMGDRKSA